MRILHFDLGDISDTLGGGQARRTWEINRRLAQQHDVTIVTSRYPGSRNEILEGIKFVRVGSAGRFPRNIPAYLASLPLVLRRHPSDLVVEDFTPPFGPLFTRLYTRRPVIASVQFTFAREMSAEFKLPFWLVEESGYKLYHDFVALSTSGADYIRKRQPRANLEILPNAMEPVAFQFQHEPEENFITYMGRIDFHQKGLDLLLKAFAQIAPHTDAKLRIIGGGSDESQMHALITELGIGARVEVLGRINGNERLRLLARSKLVALPSRYETSCLVAYEALGCAKPMLTFDVRGFEGLVTPASGLRVPPFDIEAYGYALLELLQNDALRHTKAEGARQLAQNFSWERTAQAQLEFYQKVLDRNNHSTTAIRSRLRSE